jgi:hypothetical protein
MIGIWVFSSKVYKVLVIKTTITILLLSTAHYSFARNIEIINRLIYLYNILDYEAERFIQNFKVLFAYNKKWKKIAKNSNFFLLLKNYSQVVG